MTSLKAQLLFKKICPEEDFMPPPPDPEDIIYEEEAAHEVGEAKERDGADKDKSETDNAPGTDNAQSDQPNEEKTEPINEIVENS